MTRWARVENSKVVEIIDFDPDGRFVEELVKMFVQCPDDVKQGWDYDADTGVFTEPIPEGPVEPTFPEPTTEEILADYIVDTEYRLTMLELSL